MPDEIVEKRGASVPPLSRRTVGTLASLLIVTALVSGAISLRLSQKQMTSSVNLEKIIPAQFADWRLVDSPTTIVSNPQVQEVIDRLYGAVLTRTYVNSEGYSVMLSVAHGDKQREGFAAHMPELCYSASGFAVGPTTRSELQTAAGRLNVKRLNARLGSRYEPITYWFRLGDQTLGGVTSLQQRMVELRFALSGDVPDGLLVRLSSIDPQPDRAYARHAQFANDLLAAVGSAGRKFLAGASNHRPEAEQR